jgi:hypothetical protein
MVPAQGLWVRVPVVPGALDRLDLGAPISVSRLGGAPDAQARAVPVEAPPSADPVAATVDLFYALAPDTPLRRPGERVMATLRYRALEPSLEIPSSALVRDVEGGTWVYSCDRAPVYRRVRVEIASSVGDRTELARGPRLGTCVVALGAVELLGAEFGVSH